MESIRQTIRGALEKGNAQDRDFRERVYRQAFAALERSLKAQPDLPREEARRRFDNLKATVIEIESDFAPAVTPDRPATEPSVPEVDAPRSDSDPFSDFSPRVEREDRFPARDWPEDDRVESFPPIRGDRTTKKRVPLMGLFVLLVLAILFLAIGFGIWSMLREGFQPLAALQPEAGSASAPGSAGPQGEGDWTTVFDAAETTDVQTSGNLDIQPVEEGQETFWTAEGGGPDAAVLLPVSQDILEDLAGQRVLFRLTARGLDGGETQMAITCNFANGDDCSRFRYPVGPLPAEYFFDVTLPDSPSGEGTVAVTPDIEGEGRGLEILSLQVAPAE